MRTPRLWAVVGATGTGKSETALALAAALHQRGRDAEIVNADAMQLYRGMDVGTAKLAESDRAGIRHHLLDVLEVTEDAAVAWYQRQARAVIGTLHDRGADAILVGGSGLYISSVIHEYHFPAFDPQRRAGLEAELAEHGVGFLLQRLRAQDPVAAERLDPHNARRIVRALEVVEAGGSTHGASLPEAPRLWYPDTRVIGLTRARSDLVQRLDRRVEAMWSAGLVEEVQRLRAHGLERGVTARRAIGYAQALAHLTGDLPASEAIAQTQALTRRYARRQVSWFRRYTAVTWLDADDVSLDALLD